ncbi:MAG: hypothetical protein WKF91_16870, partial [Segetibacter sp.]
YPIEILASIVCASNFATGGSPCAASKTSWNKKMMDSIAVFIMIYTMSCLPLKHNSNENLLQNFLENTIADGKYLWSEQGSDQNLQQQVLKENKN